MNLVSVRRGQMRALYSGGRQDSILSVQSPPAPNLVRKDEQTHLNWRQSVSENA